MLRNIQTSSYSKIDWFDAKDISLSTLYIIFFLFNFILLFYQSFLQALSKKENKGGGGGSPGGDDSDKIE